jgi:hypothetical protein
MAYAHSKTSRFSVDDSGGTPKEIIGVDSVQFSQGTDPVETTGIGDSSKSYINGFIDSSLSISGSWEAGATGDESDVVLSGIVGGSAGTFSYYPDDTGSGASTVIEYTGEAICTSYQISSGVGDKINYSAEFLITSAVTRNVT